jgi:predicted kinase
VLIVFAGLPATGKSELAMRVARDLAIPVLSVDPIESAIVRAGIAQGFATGLAAYMVVETLAASQLTLGQSVIVDAVNAVEPARDMWRRLAAKHRTALNVVECRCSDAELHRERLHARRRGLDGVPEPTWEQVERRRLEYTPWTEPVLAIDAVASLESNANRVLAWLSAPAQRATPPA